MTTSFPLRVSADARFLEDQNGAPFFYHADTAWRILIELSPPDTREYLNDRAKRGFNTLHVHAVNLEGSGAVNRQGDAPFHDDDLTRPNERYWRYAEEMFDEIRARDFFVALSACWFGYKGCGYKPLFTDENASVYGAFLAERFARFDNILWILGGDCDPGDKTEATRFLARTLRERVPHHLLTYHAGDGNASAAWFPNDDWLQVNMAYDYGAMDLHVGVEARRQPTRPVVLGETGYEGEGNKGFPFTPELVRRQAWTALLSGACGHAQGCAGVYNFGANWREALNFQATRDMTHLRALFDFPTWHTLQPDFEHRLLTHGWASFQNAENAVAARAQNGSLALLYTPTSRVLTLDLSQLDGKVSAQWFDPTNGKFQNASLDQPQAHAKSPIKLPTPGTNARGDEDWALLLQVDTSI